MVVLADEPADVGLKAERVMGLEMNCSAGCFLSSQGSDRPDSLVAGVFVDELDYWQGRCVLFCLGLW